MNSPAPSFTVLPPQHRPVWTDGAPPRSLLQQSPWRKDRPRRAPARCHDPPRPPGGAPRGDTLNSSEERGARTVGITGICELRENTDRCQVRVAEQIFEGFDGDGRHLEFVEDAQPLGGGPTPQFLGVDRVGVVNVRAARRCCGVAEILEEVRPAKMREEALFIP